MDPPRLPWEVIERVIDHSRGHVKTLRSLALTCRQLRPRTRLAMFARVRFKSRDHVFAFVDFLQENPHLKPIVRSIVVWPPDLAPVPLLPTLPSLSEIEFTPILWNHSGTLPELGLHQSSLTCFQRFGTHIRTLHLSGLRFRGLDSFARVLLAFANIRHLVCNGVEISKIEPPSLPETIKRRRSERMKLEALTVDYHTLIADGQATNLGRLLLDSSDLAPSTIESLTLRRRVESVPLTKFLDEYRCDWSSLRSLTLQLSSEEPMDDLGAKEVLRFLEGFPKRPSLTDVTLQWQPNDIRNLCCDLLLNGVGAGTGTYSKLEHALLAFSRPRIVYTLTRIQLSANNSAFWLWELRKHLPVLCQRGAVTLQSQHEGDVPPAGHGETIHALAVSPDSKWVASGSFDSTIILWDAADGAIAQQWVAHGYQRVWTLAFSPDSRYLVSGGGDNNAAIWDLSRGAHNVATLEGHAYVVWASAWSPDGRTIATGSSDGTTRLWDARTFRQRALYQLEGEIDRLAFSPDGRWLACTAKSRECSILDVVSGSLHKSLGGHPSESDSLSDDPHTGTPRPMLPSHAVASAAFAPGSTRLAIAPLGRGPAINVVDVETGRTLLPLEGEGEGDESAKDISFSPDGRLVLGVVGDACRIWDASTGIGLLQLKGHNRQIAAARFSPCGTYAASAAWDGTVRLWRTSDGACVATLAEHTQLLMHVAFSPDGKTLSSAGKDGRVVIRRMRDIVPPIDIEHDRPLVAPNPPSVVDPSPNPLPLPLPDDRAGGMISAGLSADEEVAPAELRPMPDREAVGELEEQRTEGDAVHSGRPGLRKPVTGASIRRDHEDEEEDGSAEVDMYSPMAEREGATVDARSSPKVAAGASPPTGGMGVASLSLLSPAPPTQSEEPRGERPPSGGTRASAETVVATNAEAEVEVKAETEATADTNLKAQAAPKVELEEDVAGPTSTSVAEPRLD